MYQAKKLFKYAHLLRFLMNGEGSRKTSTSFSKLNTLLHIFLFDHNKLYEEIYRIIRDFLCKYSILMYLGRRIIKREQIDLLCSHL